MYYFFEIIDWGYTVFIPLYFLAYVFLKRFRQNRLKELINAMNVWFCIGGFSFVLFWSIEIFFAWYNVNNHEGYAFSAPLIRIKYMIAFKAIGLICCIFYLVGKWRSNLWLTIVAYISITYHYFLQMLVRHYSDYLPSKWEFIGDKPIFWHHPAILLLLYFALIISSIYIIRVWQSTRKFKT